MWRNFLIVQLVTILIGELNDNDVRNVIKILYTSMLTTWTAADYVAEHWDFTYHKKKKKYLHVKIRHTRWVIAFSKVMITTWKQILIVSPYVFILCTLGMKEDNKWEQGSWKSFITCSPLQFYEVTSLNKPLSHR